TDVPQPHSAVSAKRLDRIGLCKPEVEGQYVVRIGAEIVSLDANKTVDHQARADQKDQRKRNLQSHKNAPQILPRDAVGSASSRFFETTDQVGFRGLQCWCDAEDHCRQDYHDGCEYKNRGIQRKFVKSWKAGRRRSDEKLQTYP